MKILKWAAVAVTALFALMNLGAALDSGVNDSYRVIAVMLAIVGAAAAVGLGASQRWGGMAVVAAGVLNVIVAVVGLFTKQDGAVIGIVVGGLGAILGGLASAKRSATA